MTPRISGLLDDLSKAERDLYLAPTSDHADAARADIAGITHSLFLAGYQPQTEERAA